MVTLFEKYGEECGELESEFNDYQISSEDLDNALWEVQLISDDLKTAVRDEDSDEVRRVGSSNDFEQLAGEIEQSKEDVAMYEKSLPRMCRKILRKDTILRERGKISYRSSTFIQLLKYFKNECKALGIEMPKRSKK